MAESIVKILASGLTFLAAIFGDAIIKKWLTWFLVAYESSISDASRKAISEAVADFNKQSSSNYSQWEQWRQQYLDKKDQPPK